MILSNTQFRDRGKGFGDGFQVILDGNVGFAKFNSILIYFNQSQL